MPPPTCLRCLERSLLPLEPSWAPVYATRAFSTSSSLAANPVKKKPVTARPTQSGRTLKLSKNTRTSTVRPPAPGERKALRKRVVLSNANALEVQGLQDLTRDNVSQEKMAAAQGKVLGFGNDTVNSLQALEGFKPTQGWRLFRRPASLVRAETVEMAGALQALQAEKKLDCHVLGGGRGSGKSVLILQTIAMAYLKGHVVIHFPEVRDMTMAYTSYHPATAADGSTIYIQPHYTAQLLQRVVNANRVRLSSLRLSKEHQLRVPVQSNISLDRFAELGANDPDLAWPVWQALWSELTAPSQPEQNGLYRPPVFVSLDGLDHAMRPTAYLDSDAKPVHAHDLALLRDFASMLSGRTQFPNGGMVLAAVSESDRVDTPTLKHFIERGVIAPHLDRLRDLRDRVRTKITSLGDVKKVDATSLGDMYDEVENTVPDTFTQTYAPGYESFWKRICALGKTSRSPQKAMDVCADFEPKSPEWNPYLAIDQRVADAMQYANVRKVHGLSKEEARGILEYYALSGMLRNTVTDSLVSERWTLAGNGIIGEIERSTARARV